MEKVYLRTRGGTDDFLRKFPQGPGLSPHTRRNRRARDKIKSAKGSISAHAEEPGCRASCRSESTVYLRTRGGTDLSGALKIAKQGLSPHTRRNPRSSSLSVRSPGSISADAEEPGDERDAHAAFRVYLRTRGGTPTGYSRSAQCPGLSPHTRRNRRDDVHVHPSHGSISAHAEEPTTLMRT